MKNFVQEGRLPTIVAPALVSSGSVVIAGTLIGIATHDAASGDDLTIDTEGVYNLPKTAAQAWTLGAAIYWDSTDKVCTTTSTNNTLIGKAVQAAANPSGVGVVRLNG